VQVTCWPGCSVTLPLPPGQVIGLSSAPLPVKPPFSVTDTLSSVTLPVLVATNEYVMTWPTLNAAATFGDVRLPPHRVVHHPQNYLARPLERYGDRKDGEPVGVIGGTVQGVDDPAGIALSQAPPTLLGQHAVTRESPAEHLPDHSLCSLVHLCNEVHLPFVLHSLFSAEAAPQYLARGLGRRNRYL